MTDHYANLPGWAIEAGKRAEAATEGPWILERLEPDGEYRKEVEWLVGMAWHPVESPVRPNAGFWDEDSSVLNEADAAFIAAARTDMPRILAAWTEDKAKLQMLEAEIEEHRQWSQDKTVRLARAIELLRRKHKDDYQNLHSAPHRSSIDRDIHTFLREEDARK